MDVHGLPETLQEAVVYFSDLDNALNYAASRRWPNGPICPVADCRSNDIIFLATRRIWKCRTCKKQFSVKVGSIFEDSALGLDKWICGMWLIANCKNGISSYEIGRDLGITQKSGWFMMHRIRLALQAGSFEKLSGEVEADETFIGGKARNMHLDVKARRITGTGGKDKTAVMGILERGGKVRTTVIPSRKKKALQSEVRKHVEAGSALYTDALLSYEGLAGEFAHKVVDHAVQYVDGQVHTNGLENFWSLLKRSINGTYVSVEPFHLFRYLDEQSFRFNNRKLTDAERFTIVSDQVFGKRLTWEGLTGKTAKEARKMPYRQSTRGKKYRRLGPVDRGEE
ncbi:MAG: IS1595 family transposase [Actinomycetota bacterium]|nr:IS1595 family transposase [Actinomycetota bacterium]